MGDQVQREIEGRDSSDRTKRESAHEAPASGSKFLPVERNEFAIDPGTLLGCDSESKDGTLDLSARRLDRLTRFLSHGAGQLFFTIKDALGYTAKYSLPLEGGKPARVVKGFYGGGDRGLGVLASALIYLGDHALV